MVLVPWGSICHWVGVAEERRESSWPAAPPVVQVPTMVWVTDAGNVRVAAELTFLVKLLKVVAPERV